MEVPLLLPVHEVAVLERVARSLGLTVGQFLRRLVGDFVARRRSGP